jgi:PST family polysaccharide transporter
MRFVVLAAIEVIALLVSAAVSIGMAIGGLGYWALIGWSLVMPAVNTIGVWVVTAWVPGAPQRKAGISSVIHFGGTVTLNIVIVYIAYNLDKVLVGRFWGANALGIYGRAYQLINLPSDSIVGAVGGVALSALSRVRDDHNLLRRYFLKGYKLVLTLTVPVTVYCGLFAEDIVLILLGPKWDDATTIFRLLTPTLLAFAMIGPTGWLLFSIGMVGRSLKIALVIAPLVISGYVIGLPHGPEGVALGFSATMVLWVVPHILWSMKGTGIAARDLFKVMVGPFVSGILAAAVTFGLQWFLGPLLSPYVRLVVGGTILVSSYLGILLWAMGEKSFYLDLLLTLKGRGSNHEAEPK